MGQNIAAQNLAWTKSRTDELSQGQKIVSTKSLLRQINMEKRIMSIIIKSLFKNQIMRFNSYAHILWEKFKGEKIIF